MEMLDAMIFNRSDCESKDVEFKDVNAMIYNRSDCESNDVESKDVNAVIYNRSDFESNDVVESKEIMLMMMNVRCQCNDIRSF